MLRNRVAIITGATRGIGRNIALTLAKNGCNIVVTGKSKTISENLPGTIYSVADEIKEYGVDVLPYQLDVRDDVALSRMVNATVNKFGTVDILINNAGALWWKNILETPVKKYDLINNINSRAAYTLSHLCLPHMIKQSWGHIIMQSPPFTPEYINFLISQNKLKNMTAYMISKLGMSITAQGIAQEFGGTGVAANAIWPMTPIESYAVKNNNLGDEKQWRKPDIISDAIMKILAEDPKTFTGNFLIDEQYLRKKGVKDFKQYQCVPGHEPPRLNDVKDSFVHQPFLL